MPKPRGEERWVAACIRSALPGVEIRQHDDGSEPSMYDLDLIRSGERFAAVEVTAAADPEALALWRLMNSSGEKWIESDLRGGWLVRLRPSARAKNIRSRLPTLLAELEQAGIQQLSTSHRSTDRLGNLSRALGITTITQGKTIFPGSIYVTIDLPHERSAGMVAHTGDALPRWLTRWLREPSQSDNLAKLGSSNAAERYLFVILPGFTTAPFGVADLLMRPGAPMPTMSPALPVDVTHVWVMSTWNGGDGFRWSTRPGWSRFAKVLQA